MAKLPPEHRRRSSSSSSSSSDQSIRVELEVGTGNESASKEIVDSTDAVSSIGVSSGESSSSKSGFPRKGLRKVTTLPVDISHGDKLESSPSKFKLERSKSDRQRYLRPEDAAQIFNDKISVQEKLRLLNRIAIVKDDGTVEFDVPIDIEPEALSAGSEHVNNDIDDSHDATDLDHIPPLNIVMLIVGTRGDVQPFVAIGKRLQDYGHRVRLATHSNFKEFVLTAGLEFYPLGGDPKVLAGYMVKNKGFLPSGPSEIPVQRSQMKEIINSLLPACKEPDIDSGVRFKADAIMANPTALGHTHVAEALQIPIHIFFTMPWSPTADFPHPLSRIKQQAGYRVSYQIVDLLIWLGMRDMINDLRKKKLKLRPVTYLSGSQGFETDIPHAYMWSPHLVPKPKGWSSLHRALHFGHLAVASILLQHGASITLEDSKSRIHVDLISGNVFQVFENEHSSVATELFSWGSGANYQLGTGNEHIQKLPCKVDSLNGSIIKLISAAKFHSVALTDRGEVNTWGFRRGGRLGHPDFDVHRGTAWAHFCGYTTHTS